MLKWGAILVERETGRRYQLARDYRNGGTYMDRNLRSYALVKRYVDWSAK